MSPNEKVMWAWRMITGKPQRAPMVASSSSVGSMSNYGSDAAMADMRMAAAQRHHHRRHRRHTHARRPKRTHTRHRTAGRQRKVKKVGKHPSTGKFIWKGPSGGKYTRGLHGHRNYL